MTHDILNSNIDTIGVNENDAFEVAGKTYFYPKVTDKQIKDAEANFVKNTADEPEFIKIRQEKAEKIKDYDELKKKPGNEDLPDFKDFDSHPEKYYPGDY